MGKTPEKELVVPARAKDSFNNIATSKIPDVPAPRRHWPGATGILMMEKPLVFAGRTEPNFRIYRASFTAIFTNVLPSADTVHVASMVDAMPISFLAENFTDAFRWPSAALVTGISSPT